jgi:hypothetical protein
VSSGLFTEEKEFGRRYNGRYHMPLLPGERGTKSGGNWVPYGEQSVTNMLDGVEESRGLSIWEQEQALIGMALQPSLYEEVSLAVHAWQREGVDFSRIRDFPHVRKVLTGGGNGKDAEASIIGRAKQAAGANEARQAGTNRHVAWAYRSETGELIGTPEMQRQTLALEALLRDNGLERVVGLSERVVRCLAVRTTGRFDDILMETRTGRLLMADLKTKKRPFRSWMAVDGQLAVYARSEYMLTEDCQGYEEGPARWVDQTEGVVLQMPSDGTPPYLRRADLEFGWQVARTARSNVDLRAYGKSTERQALAAWGIRETSSRNLPQTVDIRTTAD